MDAIIKKIVNNLKNLKNSCKKEVGKFYIKKGKVYTNKSHTEYAGTIKNNVMSLSTKHKTPKKKVHNSFKFNKPKNLGATGNTLRNSGLNMKSPTNTFGKANATLANGANNKESNNKGANATLANGANNKESNNKGANATLANGANNKGSNNKGANATLANGANNKGSNNTLANGANNKESNNKGSNATLANGANNNGANSSNNVTNKTSNNKTNANVSPDTDSGSESEEE
uniref:Uncharacterized protein n=1 Tax=viral metagenome TaxID=1070528 RepID=A0A6C0EYR3_9ZZZZ